VKETGLRRCWIADRAIAAAAALDERKVAMRCDGVKEEWRFVGPWSLEGKGVLAAGFDF
jgi:hypothetical protein